MTKFVDVKQEGSEKVSRVPERSLATWLGRGFVRAYPEPLVDPDGDGFITRVEAGQGFPANPDDAPDPIEGVDRAGRPLDADGDGHIDLDSERGAPNLAPDVTVEDPQDENQNDDGTAAGSADSTSSSPADKPGRTGRRGQS